MCSDKKCFDRYKALLDRLVYKMGISQTPVPGFITGLSGTDSTLVFLLAYDALKQHEMAQRLVGVHYVDENCRKPTWFEEHIVPWLKDKCPESTITIAVPLGGNQDQQRWADLHLRALREVNDGKLGRIHEQGYWVVGSINATEKALGTYSVLADSASIQPIQTLYKNNVLKICQNLGVPQIAIEKSQIPDCLCGRDELAAKNIGIIDDILMHRVDPNTPKLEILLSYVRETKKANDFKTRIPYIP